MDLRKRRRMSWVLISIVGVLFVACGGGAASPSSAPAAGTAAAVPAAATKPSGPPDDVTVQFTFQVRGGLASLAIAQQKGFFKDENMNVTFATGTSSLTVMASVPEGQNVFVFGPDTAAAQAISNAVPLISVATYQIATPIGLLAKPGVKLSTPKDLEGLRLGLVTGDTFQRLFPAFAKKNNVDTSKIKITTMASAARITSLLQGDVDVVSVSLDNEGPLYASQFQQPVTTLRAADFGFPLLGDGVTVRRSLVSAKPDLVKRFLRAVQRAYDAAQTTPNLAVDSALALWPDQLPKREIATAQINVTLAADKAAKQVGKPYGYVDPSAWASTLDILDGSGSLVKRVANEQYFTNDFLPDPPK
jgi:NitT/TauT family transport system substrate-binding protein